MNRKAVLVAAAVCAFSAAAVSAPRMQPGLWNFHTAIDMGMGAPQIPPEAMAMMKARGMNVPMPGQAMVSQICITPEQAAMDRPPMSAQDAQREMGCTMQNVKAVAGVSYSADMICTGERMNGKGHMDVAFKGPNHMEMQQTFKGTASGRPMTTKTQVTADFVSANCGSVKPFALPKKPAGN